MPRLPGDHGEGDKAQFAIVERPTVAAAAGMRTMIVPVMPPVTAIRQVIGMGETTV
jgi:hypothetical protein